MWHALSKGGQRLVIAEWQVKLLVVDTGMPWESGSLSPVHSNAYPACRLHTWEGSKYGPGTWAPATHREATWEFLAFWVFGEHISGWTICISYSTYMYAIPLSLLSCPIAFYKDQ